MDSWSHPGRRGEHGTGTLLQSMGATYLVVYSNCTHQNDPLSSMRFSSTSALLHLHLTGIICPALEYSKRKRHKYDCYDRFFRRKSLKALLLRATSKFPLVSFSPPTPLFRRAAAEAAAVATHSSSQREFCSTVPPQIYHMETKGLDFL